MTRSEDQQTLQQAFNLHQAGKLDKAADLYRKIIGGDPANFFALHYLGVLEAGLGNYERAKSLMARSLSIQPANIQFIENYATMLCQAADYQSALATAKRGLQLNQADPVLLYVSAISLYGLKQFQEAIGQFDKLLRLAPNHVAAINERGAVLAEMKQYDAALASFEKALNFQPQYAEAHLNKGNVFGILGRYDDAVAAYDTALAIKPDLPDAWIGRGNVSIKLHQYDGALADFARALALRPDYAEAWLGRGNAHTALEQYGDACAAFDRALALKPDLAKAWLGRGNIFHAMKHYNEALAAYDQALAMESDLEEAWFGRGNAFHALWHYDEALAAYDKALALKPDLAEAWVGRGYTLLKYNRLDDALAAMERALMLESDSAVACRGRGQVLFETNRITEALAMYDKALAIEPDYAGAISNRIFALDFAEDADFEQQQKARQYWWQHVGAPIAERSRIDHRNDRDANRRIKIGYVSADLRTHSAARCFRPMMRNHDKSQFEITCYSSSHLEDEVTQEFRQVADRWRDVAQLSDDELCEQIQTDQIDILVDLSGHTAGDRLEVFARKPAPVQVSAGATGTGLPTIDYLFSDPVACPPAVRHLFAEKVFDLPSIMTIEPVPDQLRPADPPVLSKGYVTFGVFNRVSKISDDAVSLWARILHAVPHSRILIKHFALNDPAMRRRQLGRFAAHGIPEERVAFLGASSRADHLAAFEEVDISLDPFPQNGGISALESLQMGVPVIALLGKTVSSRAAGAILNSVGLDDWISDNVEGYLAIAVKFSAVPDRLKALRHELATRVAASAVGNGAIYTKALEAAYRTMWTEYCRTGQAAALPACSG